MSTSEESQVQPTVAGFAFCFHWRQKCWPFWRGIIIFHLILVYNDERKAVFIPLTTERHGAHLCHPQPLYRTGVNAGPAPYEWLFTRRMRSPRWSSPSTAGCWLLLRAFSLKTAARIDSVLWLALRLAGLCLCCFHPRCQTIQAAVYLNMYLRLHKQHKDAFDSDTMSYFTVTLL